MILDLDFGNTRIKWRLSNQPWVIKSLNYGAPWPAEWCSLTRIRASSVIAEVECQRLTVLLQQTFGLTPEFATVLPGYLGVKLAYSQVDHFGVDRWLMLLAASQRAHLGCAILGLGTAITLDLMSDDQKHLGGWIAPGLRLMKKALADQAAGLACANQVQIGRVQPGASTLECVEGGVTHSLTGLINQFYQGSKALIPELAPWFVTGGDAEILDRLPCLPELKQKIHQAPGLLFEGLSLALPDRLA